MYDFICPMKKSNHMLSVIAPMYNEESVITSFIEKTVAVLAAHFNHYELLLIDDGSIDNTVANCLPFIKANPHIRILTLSRNYGHEIASTAGLENARGDYVILMDSDLQHPPEIIPEMVKMADEGYDVVCGARLNRPSESWLKKLAAKFFYKAAKRMTGLDLNSETGNFRLLKRPVVNSLKRMKENNRHLIMMFAYLGFKTAVIPYYCPPRSAGKTKYSLAKLFSLSLDSIIGFSAHPLRIMSFSSLFVSAMMMIYAGFILFERFFVHQRLPDGMASIIFLISGLFSVLFLFLAVISEYISRILTEVKNRPLYYINQEITHETLAQLDSEIP